MFTDDKVAGSWTELIDRLHDRGALRAWAQVEPALRGISEIHAQYRLEDEDPDEADAILGALVRLSAADGGNDQDALLLLLHQLSPAVQHLAHELRQTVPDGAVTVVAEIVCQVRSFPVRAGTPVRYPLHRRTRAWAANLKLDVRRALLQENARYGAPARCEVLADCVSDPMVHRALAQSVPGPGEDLDVDVADLLLWALRSGVSRADINALVAVEAGRDRHRFRADLMTSAVTGVATRSLYRRRQRALTGIRAISREYLAAVA